MSETLRLAIWPGLLFFLAMAAFGKAVLAVVMPLVEGRKIHWIDRYAALVFMFAAASLSIAAVREVLERVKEVLR